MIRAIEIHGAGGVAKVFTPLEEAGWWECELVTLRGPEPGGHWTSEDVARAIVDDIYNMR